MEKKISQVPQDEKELFELKNDLAENEVNLSKLKAEVLAVMRLLNVMD